MKRKALVARVEDTWVKLLSIDEEEERESCTDTSASESCGSGGCSCQVTGRPIRASLPTEIRIAPGDKVEVTYSNLQAFTGFLSIILAPIAAAWVLWYWASQLDMGQGWQAGGAILGAFLSLALLMLTRSGKSSLPRITALLESGKEEL